MDFTNYLINSGLSEETIYLLLILPFISFLVASFRQIIGLKTFGMFEPIIIAFAFYAFSTDFYVGLKYGLPILFITWAVGEISRKFLKTTRLHYISKVSLKVSSASLLILGLFVVGAYVGRTGFFDIIPLAIVIIIALVESMSLFQVKKGEIYTNLLSLETFFVALVSFYVLTSPQIKEFVLNYPYLVFAPILASLIVGRWRGFRLSEYIRFRKILKDE